MKALAFLGGGSKSTIKRTTKPKEHLISGEMEPGWICSPEVFEIDSFKELLEQVGTWLKCLQRDLQADPTARHLDNRRKEVEEVLKQQIADLGEKMKSQAGQFFTREEADSFRARLDELEQRQTDDLKKVYENQEELQRKLEKLHQTIQFLKDQVERLDKPGVITTTFRRLAFFSANETNTKVMVAGATYGKLVADIIEGFSK